MKKILIIEDNLEVRENIAEIIELSNYHVITAGNGKVGVELALGEKPDLIICDIMMPILDGYAVHHLLSKHDETASIPFIFLTAKSEKIDFRKGMEMGADDYITKPFDGIELLHAVEVRLKKNDFLKKQYGGPVAPDDFLEEAQQNSSLHSLDRETYSFSKKLTIYNEGQRPRAVYYVVSGKVKIYRMNSDGKEFITSIHGAGEYFGYSPVLEGINYKDAAEALEETQLMVLPSDAFLKLVTGNIQVAQKFIKILAENIGEKENILLHLAYASLRKKVAYGLIQLFDKYRVEGETNPSLNLTRENMAQSIGIATESLIRTLGDFKDEKLIDIKAGKVILLDEKRLRDLPY